MDKVLDIIDELRPVVQDLQAEILINKLLEDGADLLLVQSSSSADLLAYRLAQFRTACFLSDYADALSLHFEALEGAVFHFRKQAAATVST